ncbi:MAG: polyprenyl synthetase family protein [Actinomycetota bacterium]
MSSFTPTIDELVAAVDAFLEDFLGGKRSELPEAESMIDEIARSVTAGGKRLRPQFCYWGYRAAGGTHEQRIVAAASALELLHTFALVHDDIIDRSDERRGLPTTFALHGTDAAILVGDLALVLADAALMESGFDAATLQAAFASYSRMRQQVIAGQFLDVIATRHEEMTVDRARRIAVLKSGRYSIEEPLVIGAALAQASPDLVDSLHRFGAPLGEAFQLRDDLLGMFGDASTVGKPVDSDIREGKRHVLYAFTLDALSDDGRATFVKRWGADDLTGEEVDELRRIVEESGAKARTETLLAELRDEALARLAELPMEAGPKRALEELARRATDRAL